MSFIKELAHLAGRAFFAFILFTLLLVIVLGGFGLILLMFQNIQWLGPLFFGTIFLIFALGISYSTIHSFSDDVLDWILMKVGILKKKPAKHDRFGGASLADYFGCSNQHCWACKQNGMHEEPR